MIKYIVFITCFISLTVQADEIFCDKASNTFQMNQCTKQDMVAADAQLEQYLGKAKQKYQKETNVLAALVHAQKVWVNYRKAQCDAIYEKWSGGTLSGVIYGKCMARLTRERTHSVWEDYLTYMDSTPALLPEPK
ncbi:DUF1311 domain-containing protein [Parashewanella spongiae]|uniref:DUF1311 domain-containing protein n=1 Tax=Parashewanella spongiae TaxID=342950 RepID=A0A3A6TD73_9GAMM|nr:lysozyme inhibitor LprI family protein [Parashewanella spongiae]MCL1079084.1 DUF1311 domain-containing protein [Parashewanella spongiae]RJY10697.1 DUF1311 domain-containing protein [Parashewanella spongiae]